MRQFILDAGNADTKWRVMRTADNCPVQEGYFPSAISEMTDVEWQRAVGAGKPRPGFIRVNGIPYSVGNAARRYIIKEHPRGAARYEARYYGVLLAYALTQAITSDETIHLFASHAPQDASYVKDLIGAAKREWCVETERGPQRFQVMSVATGDEPVCGYAHHAFDWRGNERDGIAGLTALTIDPGGYTTDIAIVESDGTVDMRSLKSTRRGTIQVFEQFENDLRRNHSAEFKDAGDLDMRRLETAIVTGQYPAGRLRIDCQQEATEAIRGLVNDVIAIIRASGGVTAFDIVLLTGGGSALIFDELTAAFPNIEFVLVEPNRDDLRFANVRGGAKIATLMSKGEL